jgi:hypothetical protein
VVEFAAGRRELAEVKAIFVTQLQSAASAVSSARTVQEVVQATSGSSVTVTPGTGRLTLTGLAPTIAISIGKTPKR